MKHKKLAIVACVVGGVAFLIGWMPFFGAIAGLTAVGLGIAALVLGQPKALSVPAIAAGGLAVIASVVVTVLALTLPTPSVPDPVAVPSKTQTPRPTTPSPKPSATVSPSPKPSASSEPSATPKPSVPKPSSTPAPPPTPSSTSPATSGGMTRGMAEIACENAAADLFPQGVRFHWATGVLAEQLENDAWFLKVSVTPKKAADVTVECTLTGSESSPKLLAFDVY